MQMSRDVARRFQGAINSLWTVSAPSTADTRSAQGWSLLRSAAAVLCCVALLFAPQAHAQTAGAGSIQGVVTDPTGAFVPNAVVTLTEQSTQVTLTTKTSSGGDYAFPNIHIGTYTLSVTAQGFDTYTSTGNILEVGSSIAINAKLTVGSTDTKIEVRSEGLALQTEDPSFKQTIDKTEIQEMPIISNDRSIEGLVQLAGGANGGSSPGDSAGSKFPSQTGGISVAGAEGNAISWRLDGGDNNDYMSGNNNPLPFVDAIGQFSVETAALGAQDGEHIGGLVNIVTQSGTNTYHGSAFEFARRTFLDAENFFSTPTPAAPHDLLHQDQYGGTFGGHIIRDKLFAFAAFQHQFLNQHVNNSTAYVPTAANLLGDFSTTDPVPVYVLNTTTNKIVNSTPANACSQQSVQLSDPISGAILPGNKYNQPGGPALPAWNAASLALQKQLPAINPAIDVNNCGLVTYTIPNQDFDTQFDTRVDYTLNKNNTLYARYFLDSEQFPAFYSPTNILLSQAVGRPEIRYQTITIGENFVISSNVVNSVHLTATRRQLARGFNPSTPNVATFGVKDFQGVAAGIWIGESANNHGFNIGGGSNLLAVIDDNIPVDFSDDVTWIHGKHQIAFGGSILRNQLNLNNGYESDGNFNFNGSYSGAHAGLPTALNPLNPPTFAGSVQGTGTGDTNLDLLEGAMSSFTQSKPQQNALRGWIPTIYVQDTYHATPRLTLTAGLNWEPEFFPTDYFHRGVQFNQAAFLANQHSAVYPQAPAGSFFYGDPGVKPNFTNNSPWQFNPNFAVTYDLSGTGKTVVRAGVAYAYDLPNFFAQQRVQQNAPFSVLVTPNSSSQLCFSDPWLIGGNTNGGTTQGCAQQGGTDVDPFPFNNASFVFPQQSLTIVLPATYRAPNTVQWTASIQQQFSHGWNAQIFYTGNRTQHMLGSLPLNPAIYVPGVWGANGTGCPGVVTYGPAAVAAKTGGLTPGAGPFATPGTPCSVSNVNKTGSDPDNTVARAVLTNQNPLQGN
ncbi:MAG TPA: TonB-dependent receptor, partial [Acidobacteriaceae bacterium]|nr:TonB-dependent receptor [Acidobacteriaceae bacterium]